MRHQQKASFKIVVIEAVIKCIRFQVWAIREMKEWIAEGKC